MAKIFSPLAASTANASHEFLLATPDRRLRTQGALCELERGPLISLRERVERFFASRTDGIPLLVGALPFDVLADDYLFQPAHEVSGESKLSAEGPAASSRWIVKQEPAAKDFAEAVSHCVKALSENAGSASHVRKAVLSRSLVLESDSAISIPRLLGRLAHDPSVTQFRAPLPQTSALQPSLVGATPELLLSKRGATIVSHPLAGSSRRSADPVLDRQAMRALLASEKDHREHRIVTEMILDTLSPYCLTVNASEGTTIRSTASMHHLGTRIVGKLKDEATPVAELLALLHPTPAVCGLPRREAADLISRIEGYDRGFYAGAVGWIDEVQNGEWYVSIRCAEVAGRHARVFAGAGIVVGSDPQKETEETSAKFAAMLNALGIDEQGRPLQEHAA
ncbi:isochorismate synthase MenF [Rhizobium helianthi]|uniref:isochorismate synthase n=1 Tax=Rhizobium helianthi TaxID=1132695 RepID=A0ABW4M1J8_9HYPH